MCVKIVLSSPVEAAALSQVCGFHCLVPLGLFLHRKNIMSIGKDLPFFSSLSWVSSVFLCLRFQKQLSFLTWPVGDHFIVSVCAELSLQQTCAFFFLLLWCTSCHNLHLFTSCSTSLRCAGKLWTPRVQQRPLPPSWGVGSWCLGIPGLLPSCSPEKRELGSLLWPPMRYQQNR